MLWGELVPIPTSVFVASTCKGLVELLAPLYTANVEASTLQLAAVVDAEPLK